MNRLALGLIALAFSACSYGPFTTETTQDSSHWLGGFRTDSKIFGIGVWVEETKTCWALKIDEVRNYGCIER